VAVPDDEHRPSGVFDDEIGDAARKVATQALSRVRRAQRDQVVLPLANLGHDLLRHGPVAQLDPGLNPQAAQRVAAGLQVASLGCVGLEERPPRILDLAQDGIVGAAVAG
jgi:hypothetical protein